MAAFIILDRDGVINHESHEYIKTPDEWIALPGSLEAIAQLNRAGFRVLIATNQSGVGRGYYDIEMLDCIHEKLMRELAAVGGYIEEIFFCPHHPEDECLCRKPKPGLIQRIQEKYPINLRDTYFIGDSYVDVQAAKNAGCQPLLVLSGNGAAAIKKYPELAEVMSFPTLAEAVLFVIQQQEKRDA